MCGIGSDWIKEAKEATSEMPLSEKKQDRALIIFVKNPVLGKVKTRLAQTMGDKATLEAYLQMLAHVRSVAAQVECHRAVFYSDFMDEDDAWSHPTFSKHVQATGDLGDKMQKAFEEMFAEGYEKVVIVGSDLLDLQVQHLEQAFRALLYSDYVMGPANDGGYYLLGMKAPSPSLFAGKAWSTDKVLATTLADIRKLSQTVFLLPELSDIDVEEDWLAALARYHTRQKIG